MHAETTVSRTRSQARAANARQRAPLRSTMRLFGYLTPYRGITALSLLLLAFSVAADLALPRLIQTVIDQGVAGRDVALITRISLVMVGLTAVSAASTVGNLLLAVRVSQNATADMRHDLFARIQSLSYGNLDRLQTGSLMTRLTTDLSQLAQLILMTMRMFVRAPMMIIGSLILLVITSARLAVLMAVLMPAALAAFWLFAGRAQPLFLSVQRTLDRLNNILQENLAGVRVVKAFARADYENVRFAATNDDLMARTILVGRILALLLPSLRLLTNLGLLAVVWFGGHQVIAGDLSIGQVIAFNNYIFWVMFPLANLGMMVGFVASADASSQRILEVLDNRPEVAERPGATDPPPGDGRLAFEGVSMAYNGADQEPVLQSIDLVIEPGETVALLGATGAGKTTLLHLIPRFYDVAEGRITLDGVDVRDLKLDGLRAEVGIVPQESVLFTGTIRDNIRYGRPNASAEEVVAAASAAQAHAFVSAFPEGYDTMVGQRGVTLSGGQRQRLAIARALLRDPRILLMDDATSSVDVETEVAIRHDLRRYRAGRTNLYVAQRISSVVQADRIVVLERGRIAAIGTHRELLASSPIYRAIYDSQLGEGGGANGR
ncbi:MAG: ABC transporter ATP-binding protein [Anaerolineae bacterium]